MPSFNKVMLMGNLAADPELRSTKSGKKVANFRLATSRYKLTADGKKRIADYHTVVAWEGLGGICAKHLVKGSSVMIEGKLVNDNYEDEKGVTQYKNEVIANDIQIITWKNKKPELAPVG
jgi:single-strand DNA-binding protein